MISPPTAPPPLARTRRLAALVCAACLLLNAALARATPGELLGAYERAQGALSQSLALLESEGGEAALRSLRRAEAAFPALAETLSPSLRAGLEATAKRAEAALASGSATDFAVQRAVLGGALGRALYERALEEAAQGRAEEAAALFAALERAHGLAAAPEGDRGDPQRAFEHRLAAHGLEALGGLPTGDRDRDYRTLAERYGELLLVQGSPRLPAATTDALLAAIDQVVAGGSPEEPLAALREGLAAFAAASAPPARAPTQAPAAPELEAAATRHEGPAPPATLPPTPAPAAPPTSAFSDHALQALWVLLGLLALVALVQALALALAGQQPLHHLAVALLLLPASLEGLAALAPLSGWPALAPLARLSLQSAALQRLWVLLVAVAVLCLAVSWRRTTAPADGTPRPAPAPPRLASTELDWDEDF